MNTLFIDASSGISGNMFVGAMIDAGLPKDLLIKELKKLTLKNYSIKISKNEKGTKFEVLHKEKKHRNIYDIEKIIKQSSLQKNIKLLSLKIFSNLAVAESKAHNVPVKNIHFHEVGAIDSIIDIVSTSIGLNYFEIDEAYSSPINTGSGKIRHEHGILSVPSPAASFLLKGIPIFAFGPKKELTTPTGAAIIKTIVRDFSDMPRLILKHYGEGLGDYSTKNFKDSIRIFIGKKELGLEFDLAILLETNLDDFPPNLMDKAIKKFIALGAYDAWFEKIRMKKERIAAKLSVISPIGGKNKLLEAIFKATPSFGVRTYVVKREKLKREFKTSKTKYGKIKVKVGLMGKEITAIAPEYEDYKKLSKKHKIPLSIPYKEALKKLQID